MNATTILYQTGEFTVRKAAKGFEVYRDGGTVARRVAVIGYEGSAGLARAIAEADRRNA